VQSAPASADLPLHDRQIRVTAEGDDRYEHTLRRLTGAQTGEHATQLWLNVDPRFQELVVHAVRLTHAGEAARIISAAQLREALQAQPVEADVRKRELNPQLQFSLQLLDARPGDALECEYTIHSRAAGFPGLIAGHYAAQWSSSADQPLRWERLRVIWPASRNLQFRLSGGGAGVPGGAPQIQTHRGELEIQWRDLVPVSEQDTPRWFERQSLVQLSDFADWSQVATLLAPRYGALELAPPPEVAATPEMILGALHLVQSKVRTTSVASAGSYVPADPDAVLHRGYGDGRDLARLLVSLLRRLGIDAQVALADSRRGALLDTSLPSPYLLDTALVLAHAGNTQYWINPATPGPTTTLATTDTSDLRHALVLTDRGGAVVLLPPPAPDSRLRSVTQRFDLHAGNAQPGALTVVTRFRGGWAQAVRAELAEQSQAQLQLTQIQGVMQDYPTATNDGEVLLQDLPDDQTLQLTARFRLSRPLGAAADPQFNFFAEAIAEAVQPRDEATRELPLSVPWPLKLEENIEAVLPADFVIPPGLVLIESKAFRYQREVRFSQGTLHIAHSYVALSDHVDPADYPKFLEANAQVYQVLGLRVRPAGFSWRRSFAALDEHWLALAALLAVAGGLASLGWRRLRRA
jgi:transglutaminase-like putative cysteine protease